MNMLSTPIQGGYTYRTRNYDGSFNIFYLSVEVIGETAQSYLVRLLTPIVGHPVRSTMTVRKHNVKIHSQEPEESTVKDCADEWWNN